MRARRNLVATAMAGVVTVALAGTLVGALASCGGPTAFAAVEGGRARVFVPAEIVVGNPDARFVRVPVLVASDVEGARVLSVSVAGPGGRVVGRTVGRKPLTDARRAAEDSRQRGLGRYQTVTFVQVDLKALGVADGASRSAQVRAVVARDAAVAHDTGGAPAANGQTGGTERETLEAESMISVSAIPTPGSNWFPGDAHLHSTVSDGWLGMAETFDEAKNVSGMKWLVLTDHWVSGSGGGGVAKYPATGGAPVGFASYYDAVLRHGKDNTMPIGPACEWSSVKTALPGTGSHVLGMAESREAAAAFPGMWSETRQNLVDRLNARNTGAFTVAAHPEGTQANGMFPWDWTVARNDCVELFTDMTSLNETIRKNWFARLRSELPNVIANGPEGKFTVGIASSDSHMNGITANVGASSITWLWLPNGERELPSPGNVAAMWKRLRAGQCVASGTGDFARPTFVTAAEGKSYRTGPGGLTKQTSGASVGIIVTFASRTRHRLKSIEVWRGDASGVVKHGPYAVDAESGTKSVRFTGPTKDCFYVVVAHFYDTASLNTSPRDVVCNPVWVEVR